MANFDILIIGGGPGACSAAIYAAERGLKVCLIERERFPRERPGETLHPGLEPLLKQLGVFEDIQAANFVRHSGIWVTWNSAPTFQPYSNDKDNWQGFQAYRSIFDNLLLKKVYELNVEVLMECRAEKILQDKQRVAGIQTNSKIITADYVIDASGHWQWLARQLQIPIEIYSKKLLVRYGYVNGYACSDRDINPAIVADEMGWTWTARIGENLYQWTRLVFEEKLPPSNWLPEEFKHLMPVGSAKGADVTWRKANTLAGPGYFLVGDAAVILAPASSHGVLRAIMSGIRAADYIFHIKKHHYPELNAINEYQRWMTDWFNHDIAKLNSMYENLNQDISIPAYLSAI